MSEVNYRRNGQKYSSNGRCWGVSPKVGNPPSHEATEGRGEGSKPKSSRERRATSPEAAYEVFKAVFTPAFARDVFKEALKWGARALMVAHNFNRL